MNHNQRKIECDYSKKICIISVTAHLIQIRNEKYSFWHRFFRVTRADFGCDWAKADYKSYRLTCI